MSLYDNFIKKSIILKSLYDIFGKSLWQHWARVLVSGNRNVSWSVVIAGLVEYRLF